LNRNLQRFDVVLEFKNLKKNLSFPQIVEFSQNYDQVEEKARLN
jgi:hypothetical protein